MAPAERRGAPADHPMPERHSGELRGCSREGVASAVYSSFHRCRSCGEPFKLCSLGFGRHRGTTAQKGNFVKYKKGAAVVAGAIMTLGLAAPAMADSGADGSATNSPGVLSGNVVQIPVHIPVNACGNSLNVLALLNPAYGNACSNH
jgi:hypothetical protein